VARYDTITAITSFYNDLEERLRALPGVTSVASSYGPPMGSGNISGEVRIEGRPAAARGQERYASMHSVTAGWFETAGIPILRGRPIEATDRTGTLPVAVVSRRFVEENFTDEDPLGKRFEVTADFGYGNHVWTIVGVAGDVRRAMTDEPEAEVYVPHGQYGPNEMTLTMRTSASIIGSDVREVVRSIDPGLPIMDFQTVRDAMREAVAPTRFYLVSMIIFGGLALTLACVGLYGVVACIVSRRDREIGIRIALGARRDHVIRLVLAHGVRPAIAGVALGILLTLAAGRVAESLLFQVSPRDPLILVTTSLVLALVSVAASLVPALRASRTDPAATLRI
jgi:putative ABC transport system permease protein